MIPHRNETDKLVHESERLRRELLRTAARLDVFANELTLEARRLSDEAASIEEDGTDERGDFPGGPEHGQGPDTGPGSGDGTTQ